MMQNEKDNKGSVDDYLKKLEAWFQAHPKTITAFSGGVDSSIVLYLSKYFLGKDGIGCISASASLKSKDLQLAKRFCAEHDIYLEIVITQEMKDDDYMSNPTNRCYFCKNHLYLAINEVKSKFTGYEVLNGTNIDDLGDYRPGLEAAKEYDVRSPLVDCKVNKEGVRLLARHFGLENWDKPASPCLSSRIPYGTSVSIEKLMKIESAEELLNNYGFEDVRVRYMDGEASIEVEKDKIEKLNTIFPSIESEILKIGFKKCSVDQEGLVSGKLNRVLNV